jgi:putative nucleotidyltransferase with HDIG domain
MKECRVKIPSMKTCLEFIRKAGEKRPGAWLDHSAYVAKAAKAIALHHQSLDPEIAFIMGYLHDIGRQEGASQMRHIIDGYGFLQKAGFDDAARICLTHSFPIRDIKSAIGQWDCSEQEIAFVHNYLSDVEYDEYDRLIQLCDALAMPSGFVLIEKRLHDVSIRYGVNDFTVPRWKAYSKMQTHFEEIIGVSIYSCLPGVVENTILS